MKRALESPCPGADNRVEIDVSFGSVTSVDQDTSNGSIDDGESPKARDWLEILKKSGKDNKNLFINDCVHGHIKIPDLCRAIIDTPQFGRLRNIRQLGSAYFVYPCAKHTRWEHSVGVMHLAGYFVNHLRHPDNFPGCCDSKDQLCVMIAGLCHDLGHGPFSHLWEHFVNEARPEKKWSHEQASLTMFDFLVEENNLTPVFEEHGLTKQDMFFIKELINGPLNGEGTYTGREPDKHFLYEIVANKNSGIDVDKWDYFLRDNMMMTLGLTFDYKRFILMSHLKVVGGKKRLAIEEKEAINIKKLFEDRARLHNLGYQHKVVKKIEQMTIDALLAADQQITIYYDRKGKSVRLSDACDDMYVYSQLTDQRLFEEMQYSISDNLLKAREICNRIVCRKLYKHVGTLRCKGLELNPKLPMLKDHLLEKVKNEGKLVQVGDLSLVLKSVNSGMGRDNPVEKVLFLNSKGKCTDYNSKYLKEMMSIEEEEVFVFLRPDDKEITLEAQNLFRSWIAGEDLPGVHVIYADSEE